MKSENLTVMFTDIKGFTPKTATISRKELEALLETHDRLIMPVFSEFGGKIVKTIGDAFMVVFRSPTDAVLCGMKIQDRLAEHNKALPSTDHLEVRVAINSGEVNVKGADVFGEAVNIAARLEGIAKANDIYFTESVYLAMNKSEIPTAEVGYHALKGIPDKIRVFKVLSKKRRWFFREKEFVRGGTHKLKKILGWTLLIFLTLLSLHLMSNAPGPGGLFLLILTWGTAYYIRRRKRQS